MSAFEILCTTMHQKDLSKVREMNIHSDVLFANQADRTELREETIDGHRVRMITTQTRGVGKNRNLAMTLAEGDICLLADDDVVYRDDMPRQVCKAFDEMPQADVIIFGMDIVKNGVVTEKRHLQRKKRHVWDSLRFGTYTIAVRRRAILQHNITFNQLFGGGCMYSAGEDSLFLKSCFDAGLRVYSHEYVLGTCCKDTSSWFTGYGEKYFYDKGVLVRHLFPKTCYLMAAYFAIRFKRETAVSVMDRLKLVYAGVRGGKTLAPYQK